MSNLELTDVVVALQGTPVLRGVSLAVPHGELVAVVGPSGCGKTTLLRTIAGLQRARAGEIRSGTRILTTHGIHLAPEKRRVGWVPQDAALFPHLTVAGNVAFGFGPQRPARAVRETRTRELLELVDLGALADRYPAQLSGGQAQRVALARALAADPDVVLLDEPFAALDPQLRGALRAEVRELLRATGVTGVLVTHDQAEALSIADRVAVMNGGEIVQYGTPSDVYERPASPWVAAFVGDAVEFEAMLHAGIVTGPLGDIPADVITPDGPHLIDGDSVTAIVRPEQLELTIDGPGVPGTVVGISFTGHDALLAIALADDMRIDARVSGIGVLPLGTAVRVSVRGRARAYPA